jgi:hypothetical protein
LSVKGKELDTLKEQRCLTSPTPRGPMPRGPTRWRREAEYGGACGMTGADPAEGLDAKAPRRNGDGAECQP